MFVFAIIAVCLEALPGGIQRFLLALHSGMDNFWQALGTDGFWVSKLSQLHLKQMLYLYSGPFGFFI